MRVESGRTAATDSCCQLAAAAVSVAVAVLASAAVSAAAVKSLHAKRMGVTATLFCSNSLTVRHRSRLETRMAVEAALPPGPGDISDRPACNSTRIAARHEKGVGGSHQSGWKVEYDSFSCKIYFRVTLTVTTVQSK